MKHYPLIFIGLLLFSTTMLALEKASPKQIDEVQQRVQQMVPYAIDTSPPCKRFPKTVHGVFSMLSPNQQIILNR